MLEKETREFIDHKLKKVKRDVTNNLQVVTEFPIKKEGTTLFADYALIDVDSKVIAIVEAKKYSRSAREGEFQADGYSLDDKRNPINDNDIPDVLAKFKECVNTRSYDKEPEKGAKWFRVDKEEIKKNNYDLSISKYKKIIYTPVKYEDPKVLINQIRSIEDQIKKGLDEVEKMI